MSTTRQQSFSFTALATLRTASSTSLTSFACAYTRRGAASRGPKCARAQTHKCVRTHTCTRARIRARSCGPRRAAQQMWVKRVTSGVRPQLRARVRCRNLPHVKFVLPVHSLRHRKNNFVMYERRRHRRQPSRSTSERPCQAGRARPRARARTCPHTHTHACKLAHKQKNSKRTNARSKRKHKRACVRTHSACALRTSAA